MQQPSPAAAAGQLSGTAPEITDALVVANHMVERYGYHALEILQSQVELRPVRKSHITLT